MKKSIFLLLFTIFYQLSSFGQKESYIWYFGQKAGLSFHTNPPTALHDGEIDTWEGCASVSDPKGNLLFYTNGITIWDSTHNIMQNGTDLAGDLSSTQSAVVVKAPGSFNKYYVFTSNVSLGLGLQYSVIDMSANLGKGAVTIKNTQMATNTAEKICTIPHANGTDFWVLTKAAKANLYYIFLVNSSGVSSTPLTQNIGNIGKINYSISGLGAMKASPDFTKVAVADYGGGLELIDFDNQTGKLSDAKALYVAVSKECYGVEFSPNGKVLYVSINDPPDDIWQYDISSNDEATIKASMQKLIPWIHNEPGTLQLGPDGKIYFAIWGSGDIGVINKPNLLGTACDLDIFGVNVYPGLSYFGLPTFYPGYVNVNEIKVDSVCLGDSTILEAYASNKFITYDSVQWHLGDNNIKTGNPVSHLYANTGEYDVTAILFLNDETDTIEMPVSVYNQPQVSLKSDTGVCEGDTLHFELASFDTTKYTFLWSDSSTRYKFSTDTTMELSVTVDIGGCAGHDTIQVTKVPYYNFDNLNDTLSCKGDTLFINIGKGADNYIWSNGITDSIGVFTQTGKYYVQAKNWNCITEDSLHVQFYPKPLFSLGADTVICNTDSITLTGTSGVKHLWNVGDTTQNITVKNAGEYILKQSTNYCDYSDTITLNVQQQPSLFIGNDTVVCIGAKVIMGATIPNGIQYTWNNRGDATPKITTDSQSTYSVIAYDGICRAYDTIFVGVYTPQSIELGADSTLCEGTQTLLDATINRGKYIWNDGAQTPTKLVKQAGTYSVLVTDSVCQYSDAVTISFTPVPPLYLDADTFLCQNEVYQLAIDNTWEKVVWNDGSTDYNRIFTAEGKYVVTADFLNCQVKDSVNIHYHPLLPKLDLGPDADVCDPLFYPLQANYTGYYGLVWQDGTEGDTYEVTQTGDYIIRTKPHRCGQVSDTVNINFLRELCDLHVPTAFSPNGDGRNDTFFPVGYQADVESMQIFNRWGELLFDANEPWDGTYKGEPVPQGNYLYIITYKKEHRGGEKRMFIKGTVMVIR